MPLSRKTFQSPAFAFVVYVLLGCLAIMLFRNFFPGEAAPLPIFDRAWPRVLGFQDVIALFPALAFSALVLPFGAKLFQEERGKSGSPVEHFRRNFMAPIIVAICAASVYALLFFLALPALQGREEQMRFDGEAFRMARDNALARGEAGQWLEAAQLASIAESVWRDNPYLGALQAEARANLEAERFAVAQRPEPARLPALAPALENLPGHWEPLTTAEAMTLSRAAYDEGRMFDAHWFASVGQRLAPVGSPDAAVAAGLAARAWNQIESLRPTAAEARARELFELMRSGYNAMLEGDYISAFYIFQEHARLAPRNPDVENFLARSERGLAETAFFIDQMNARAGGTAVGPVLSLPVERDAWSGRAVIRLDSLSFTRNSAFAVGLEYMLFDHQARLVAHVRAPYAKFIPFTMGGPYARRQVHVLMQALDRNDPDRRWQPSVETFADQPAFHPNAPIVLDVSYETFLMLVQMQNDVSAMRLGDLREAAMLAEETGQVPQVFETELLRRLGSGLFFLPAAIAAIVAGWYFRARRFPRFIFIPAILVLPVVFNGIAHIIRVGLNIIGASLTLALGFPAALVVFSLILAAAFVCSLFLLAVQRD